MPRPFNSYLEVEDNIRGEHVCGTSRIDHRTAGEIIKVINAPIGGIVKIVGTSPSKIFAKGIVRYACSAAEFRYWAVSFSIKCADTSL